MSTLLYVRPLPTDPDPTEDFFYLKRILAKAGFIGEGDGSLYTEPFKIMHEELLHLKLFVSGVAAGLPRSRGKKSASPDEEGRRQLAQECEEMLELIATNPQGLEIWIGE